MRALIQLGAGPIQRELLAELVESGVVPVVVDRSENPKGLVEGALHLQAPIDDPVAVKRALVGLSRILEPVAVLTSTDLGIPSVAAVSAALGLPHASAMSIAVMDDKVRAKEQLERAGVRVPRGVVVERETDRIDFDFEGEVVVKPVDASGSRGVSRARSRGAIARAVRHALSFGKRALVEECIVGHHVDVNGTVVDGRFELVTLGRRYFSDPPWCVPLCGILAANENESLVADVERLMQRAVDAFEYRHGPIKADLIVDHAGPVLLECAARFHGDVLSFHTARAAGRVPAVLQWLARLGVVAPQAAAAQAGAWFGVFADRAGVIEEIRGLDALRTHATFRDWIPRFAPGDRIGEPRDNRALVGFAILAPKPSGDVAADVDALRRSIRVEVRPADDRARAPRHVLGREASPIALAVV